MTRFATKWRAGRANVAVFALVFLPIGVEAPPASRRAQTFAVFTRLTNDKPYYAAFFAHYLALGFDFIIALDTTGNHEPAYAQSSTSENAMARGLTGHVEIHRVPDLGDALFHKYFHLVKNSGATWVFVVDSDEYLLLSDGSIQAHVERVEAHARRRINFFGFIVTMHLQLQPWCSAEPLSKSLASGTLSYGIFIKSMSRVANLKGVTSNCPVYPSGQQVRSYIDGQVRTGHSSPRVEYMCMASDVNRLAPAVTYDSALVHVHTRSISNMLMKALTVAGPQARGFAYGNARAIASAKYVRNLVRDSSAINADDLFFSFLSALGEKARYPVMVMIRGAGVYGGDDSVLRAKILQLLRHAPTTAAPTAPLCAQALERAFVRDTLLPVISGGRYHDSANGNVTMAAYESFINSVALAYKRIVPILQAEVWRSNSESTPEGRALHRRWVVEYLLENKKRRRNL